MGGDLGCFGVAMDDKVEFLYIRRLQLILGPLPCLRNYLTEGEACLWEDRKDLVLSTEYTQG